MKNVKLYIILGVVILVVAAAAFIGGRFLIGSLPGQLGILPLGGGGSGSVVMSGAINAKYTPAPEQPTTAPDLTGSYAGRQDSTIFIQKFNIEGDGSGVSIVVSNSASDQGDTTVTNPAADSGGPKVEVVTTSKTKIYRDVTPFGEVSSGDNPTIQQVLEETNLDDLTSSSMVNVWGRKSGDRIIADVIIIQTPVTISH
jgi:hypothetical protein